MNKNDQSKRSTSADWQDDPRLSGMDKHRLQFLAEYAGRIREAPQSSLPALLLSLNGEAYRQGIRFSDAETRLIVSVLTEEMTPAQKRRADALQQLSQKLNRR